MTENKGPLVYDRQWYSRYLEAGSFEAYDLLGGDKAKRESTKAAFLAGENRNPALDYPNMVSVDWQGKEQQLLSLKHEVVERETNEVVKHTYRWRINEKIAELRMLRAAQNGDMRRFLRYGRFVYGQPSPDIFAFTVRSVIEKAEQNIASSNPDIKQASKEVLDILPATEVTTTGLQLPNQATLTQAQEITFQEFPQISNLPKQAGPVSLVAVKAAFAGFLEQAKIKGWEIVEGSSFSVSQEKRQIRVAPLSNVLKLQQLVLHEIGTHLMRREKGERSRLMLLGLGLDRYLRGDEGVATMREQVFRDKITDFGGFDGHLAISLAIGLDGKPRDFRGVFEVLEKVYFFDELVAGKTREIALSAAREKAYNRCIRTFRGTDCSTPGVCFLQDVVYREGNIGVWELIRENPAEMLRFNLGKYDPTNPRHLWILEQLGITDKDLDDLEK